MQPLRASRSRLPCLGGPACEVHHELEANIAVALQFNTPYSQYSPKMQAPLQHAVALGHGVPGCRQDDVALPSASFAHTEGGWRLAHGDAQKAA